jgi:putative methyltransferase (TIGR04325 family)
MIARDLVPPALLAAVRKLKASSGKATYANYAEAMAACSKDGYENHKLVEVVVKKTVSYRDSIAVQPVPVNATNAYSLAALLLSMVPGKTIHVLDFGGAAGAHYFLARSILPEPTELNWVVVETPAMVQRAGLILGNQELRFTIDLNEAVRMLGQVDLLHTSGTLQCVPEPYEQLRQLIDIQAQYMLFNRLAVTQGDHEVITILRSQLSWNGPGPMPDGLHDGETSYPFTFPRESIIREMIRGSYAEIAEFEDSSGIFPVAAEPIVGMGLLVRSLRS